MLDLTGRSRAKKKISILHVLAILLVMALIVWRFSQPGYVSHNLLINEVMASNRGNLADSDGDYPDWIEIHNSGRQAVNLGGFWLSDDATNPIKWQFPAVEIGPGEYLLVFASGKDRAGEDGELHTNFRLSAGETVVLSTPDMRVVDAVELGLIPTNISYGRVPGSSVQWSYYLNPTPGAANGSDYIATLDFGRQAESPVYVNEFLAVNSEGLLDEDRDRSDWIEIYNSGEQAVDLEGYWLSDRAENPFRWRFPRVVLEPGEYLVVFASGKDRSDPAGEYLHTNFSIARSGEQVVFSAADGSLIDLVGVENQIADVSMGRSPDDREEWLYYPTPTPGQENFTQGFESLSGIRSPGSSHLHINEALASNTGGLRDSDGDHPDWIEIFNSGDVPVSLSGYGLTDNPAEPFRWVFPDVEIEPASFLVIFASGKDRAEPGEELHTSFRLAAAGETLVLSCPAGETVDELVTGALGSNVSVGRYPDGVGDVYVFAKSTPGAANSSEPLLGFTRPPQLSHSPGFYQGPQQITLALSDWEDPDAVIRYTLTGREPDQFSSIYTGPISISGTTVLRAKAFATGKLPSQIVNATYFIDERVTLPVFSILMDPDDLWDYRTGIYVMGPRASEDFPYVGANFWQRWERPINYQFFEADGTLGYSFDAGIRIGGQYSRAVPQKIFNIFARNQYGSNVMEYPFFPDKDLTSFKAITLRQSGQDWNLSMIRDTFMSSLLSETDLDYQAYRPTLVFLNGEYWGIYNIRERINEHFIAYNHDISPDNIDLLQANQRVRHGSADDYLAMRNFIAGNDMRLPENYAYVKTQMDVTNYIDYWIAQIYFGNTDSVNIRFWKEHGEDGRWRWIVYDLDWGFFTVNHNTLVYVTNPVGTGYARALSTIIMTQLLRNNDFRQEFVDRFVYHMNHTFTTERVLQHIEARVAEIEAEVPRHLARWGISYGNWQRNVDFLVYYAERRGADVLGYIQRYFGLTNEEMRRFNAWTR